MPPRRSERTSARLPPAGRRFTLTDTIVESLDATLLVVGSDKEDSIRWVEALVELDCLREVEYDADKDAEGYSRLEAKVCLGRRAPSSETFHDEPSTNRP